MDRFKIDTHDFEESKNQIKDFFEQTSSEFEFDKVDTSGGIFGLLSHNVKGEELNTLTKKIQDYLVDFSELNTKFIKEFGQVYNALEALDKDYINAILIALKAAEKANYEVKIAQSDITNTIDIQKKTIAVLKKFKERIESQIHLDEIDKMWDDLQRLQNEVETFSDRVANDMESIKNDIIQVKLLASLKKKLENYEHIDDIDLLWDMCYTAKKEIIESKSSLRDNEGKIDELKKELHLVYKKNDEQNQLFSKKLKIVFALAGGAISIAAIEFILIIMGII